MMIRTAFVLASGAATLLYAVPAEAAQCASDAEVETAVGEQVRSGAFTVDARPLEGRPLCSGLTIAQAIQKLHAEYLSQTPTTSVIRASAAHTSQKLNEAAARKTKSIERSQIAGAWVPQGEICESDAGIGYEMDGSWSTMNESGDWTLVGQHLTLVTREHHEDGNTEVLRTPCAIPASSS
jgi:hypothetical protein